MFANENEVMFEKLINEEEEIIAKNTLRGANLVRQIKKALSRYNAWNESETTGKVEVNMSSTRFVFNGINGIQKTILNEQRQKQGLKETTNSLRVETDDSFNYVFRYECLEAYKKLKNEWEGFQGPSPDLIGEPQVKVLNFYTSLYYLLKDLVEVKVTTIEDSTFKVSGLTTPLQVVVMQGQIPNRNEFVYIYFNARKNINKMFIDWKNIQW